MLVVNIDLKDGMLVLLGLLSVVVFVMIMDVEVVDGWGIILVSGLSVVLVKLLLVYFLGRKYWRDEG